MNNGFSATDYQMQQKKTKSYRKSYCPSNCWPYHKSPRSEAESTWDGTYEYYCIKRLDVTKYFMTRTLCELYIYFFKNMIYDEICRNITYHLSYPQYSRDWFEVWNIPLRHDKRNYCYWLQFDLSMYCRCSYSYFPNL